MFLAFSTTFKKAQESNPKTDSPSLYKAIKRIIVGSRLKKTPSSRTRISRVKNFLIRINGRTDGSSAHLDLQHFQISEIVYTLVRLGVVQSHSNHEFVCGTGLVLRSITYKVCSIRLKLRFSAQFLLIFFEFIQFKIFLDELVFMV